MRGLLKRGHLKNPYETRASTSERAYVLLSITTITTLYIIIIIISHYHISITPSPPTKSLDFRGFDSSKLLILKGGDSYVRIIL